MSRKLNVGDTVIIKGSGGAYSLSRDGSIGVVVQTLNDEYVSIKFEYLSGDYDKQYTGSIFTIDSRFVHPTENKTAMERKIKYMWERQPYFQKIRVEKVKKGRKQHAHI